MGRALKSNAVGASVVVHQIRDFAEDKHHTVDDAPFGGGPGMIMRPDVLFRAWETARAGALLDNGPEAVATILFTPAGTKLDQSYLEYFAATPEAKAADGASPYQHLILICGRFEGVDERFVEECVDYEMSLGDFVLSGGEPAALAFIDGVIRLQPGVLGNENSLQTESFSPKRERGLEYPQYTQPREFRGKAVPDVLLSGHHRKIQDWREAQARKRTIERRPDLLEFASPHKGTGLSGEDTWGAEV